MKVTKLDRRYNCNHIMKYMVETTYDFMGGTDARAKKFVGWREWCWSVFGPSSETKWLVLRPVPAGTDGQCRMVTDSRWAWDTEHGNQRLYFKDDETLSAFMLQWG